MNKIWHLLSFSNGVHAAKQRISAIDCPDAIVVKDANNLAEVTHYDGCSE